MIACDLGSNTLRIVEIDCQSKERIKEFEKIVKTAEGIATYGLISDNSVERVIAAINEAKEIFEFKKDGYKAVTTAALRLAKNSKEVLDRIYQRTNIRFEIVDGEQEAKYTLAGVENRLEKLGLDTKSYILLDLGGGSCEVILKEESTIKSKSFDVGIVTLVEKYTLENIDNGIKEMCKPIQEYAKSLQSSVSYFVGASGTPTTIAAFLQGMDYKQYDYTKINGYELSVTDMQKALFELLDMDIEKRVKYVGVGRDDLIIAGVKILLYIVEIFNFNKIIVIDDGLREGVGLLNCH